jgi:hypothetical protein
LNDTQTVGVPGIIPFFAFQVSQKVKLKPTAPEAWPQGMATASGSSGDRRVGDLGRDKFSV